MLTKTPTGKWGSIPEIKDSGNLKTNYSLSDNQEIKDEIKKRIKQEITIDLSDIKNRKTQLIHIKEDKELDLNHEITGDQILHTIIIVEEKINVKIKENFSGNKILQLIELHLKKGSKLIYESNQTTNYYMSIRDFDIEENVKLIFFDEHNNESFVRTTSNLIGDNSETKLLAIYKDEPNIKQEAIHHGKNTKSRLLTKGFAEKEILYEGILRIEKSAEGADAFQKEEALLLSDDAKVKASPQLYIKNYDVKCSHAATVSKPDVEKLYYLQTRGLSKSESITLIKESFLEEVRKELRS